jgi:hypothetical protein
VDRVSVFVLIAVAAAASTAATVPLSIEIDAPDERCLAGVIRIHPLCSDAGCGDAVARSWRATAAHTILEVDAPAAYEWSVAAESPRCWAPTVRVARDAAAEPVRLRMWQAGALVGRLTLPPDIAAPEEVTIRLESTPLRSGGALLPPTIVRCPIASRRFRCDVPATTLDLRVSMDGLAPRYVWNVEVGAGATADLGELRLERGGSLAGFVQFDGEGPPLNDVVVEIAPTLAPPTSESAAAEAAEQKRLSARAVKSRPNARGFFQFAQLEPGQYTVTARQEKWSAVRVAEIRVEAGRETELERALVIEPLSRVEVLLQPPLDPYGQPWMVSLRELTPLATTSIPVAEGAASMTGSWSVEGVNGGVHMVTVKDHRGNAFERSTVDVSPRMAPVQVAIDALAVTGTVRIGDEPIAARMELRNGRTSMVVLQADAEGRFTGALPTEGKWEIQIEARRNLRLTKNVDIRRRDDGPTEVDLTLPDTRITGVVVNESGKPVRATVRVHDSRKLIIASGSSGDDGRFEFVALDEGEVRLSARSVRDGVESSLVPVSVTEDLDKEITIVVRPQVTVKGWLVTPTGRPVAGAFVRWMIPHRDAYYEEVSGPSGQFQISLPDDAGVLDLVILPPAMPVKVLSIPIQRDMERNVEVVVGGPAGVLELEMENDPPFPMIQRYGRAVSVSMLRYPLNWTSPPRDRRPWGMVLELEAGDYSICSDRHSSRCARVQLAPGAVERVHAGALAP